MVPIWGDGLGAVAARSAPEDGLLSLCTWGRREISTSTLVHADPAPGRAFADLRCLPQLKSGNTRPHIRHTGWRPVGLSGKAPPVADTLAGLQGLDLAHHGLELHHRRKAVAADLVAGSYPYRMMPGRAMQRSAGRPSGQSGYSITGGVIAVQQRRFKPGGFQCLVPVRRNNPLLLLRVGSGVGAGLVRNCKMLE